METKLTHDHSASASSSSRSLTLLPLLNKLGETNSPAETRKRKQSSGTSALRRKAEQIRLRNLRREAEQIRLRNKLNEYLPRTTLDLRVLYNNGFGVRLFNRCLPNRGTARLLQKEGTEPLPEAYIRDLNRFRSPPSCNPVAAPERTDIRIDIAFRQALRDHLPATRTELKNMIEHHKYKLAEVEILLGVDTGKIRSFLSAIEDSIPEHYQNALKEFRDSSHAVHLYPTHKHVNEEEKIKRLQSLYDQLTRKIPTTVEEFKELREFGSNFLDTYLRFPTGEARNYILRADKKPLSREKIEKIKNFCESFKESLLSVARLDLSLAPPIGP